MKFTIYIFNVFVAVWSILCVDSVRQLCPASGSNVINVCKDGSATDTETVYLDTSFAPTFAKVTCPCSVSSEHHTQVTASFTPGSNTETISFGFPTDNLTDFKQTDLFISNQKLDFWYRSTNQHERKPACLTLIVNKNKHTINVSCGRYTKTSTPTPTTQRSSFVETEKPESTNYVPIAVGVSSGVVLIAVTIVAALICIRRKRNNSEGSSPQNFDQQNQIDTIVDMKLNMNNASDDNYKGNAFISTGYKSVDGHTGINLTKGTSYQKAGDDYYSTVSNDRCPLEYKTGEACERGNNAPENCDNDEQEAKTHPKNCVNAAFNDSPDVYNHLNEKETVPPLNVYGRLTTDADHPKDLLNEYDHIEQPIGETNQGKDETYDSTI